MYFRGRVGGRQKGLKFMVKSFKLYYRRDGLFKIYGLLKVSKKKCEIYNFRYCLFFKCLLIYYRVGK